ncbi:hypothetical protein [Adhaeretor mobilis]|uniref:Uncharacterized protein n=1 Tax=Adhaeretor mobilis TaxID=1930276 RepID=A0A517MT18_9BACT|nr:hypothetical protein [Adhaeretor mobilis]QDS98019.1 hypothetical protein HG15A2_12890 [Adhaeretor mobilis]
MTISRTRWEYIPLVCTGLLAGLGGVAIAQAQAPPPVVVATDQEDKAIVDAVVEEIQRQGGSIVPPLEASPQEPPHGWQIQQELRRDGLRGESRVLGEVLDPPARENLRFDPSGNPALNNPGPRGGVGQPRERHERRQLDRDRPREFQREQRGAHHQPAHSRSSILRDSSWHLEEVAHRLEVEGLYREADAIRGTARTLRERSRELARSEESKPNKSDDPRERTLGAVQ